MLLWILTHISLRLLRRSGKEHGQEVVYVSQGLCPFIPLPSNATDPPDFQTRLPFAHMDDRWTCQKRDVAALLICTNKRKFVKRVHP